MYFLPLPQRSIFEVLHPMKTTSRSKLTQSVHAGSDGDPLHKGLVTPIYPSSAYDYEDLPTTQYPRYFNTPNQLALARKMAALDRPDWHTWQYSDQQILYHYTKCADRLQDWADELREREQQQK